MVQPWLEKFIRVNMSFDFMFNFDVKWVIDCSKEIIGDYILTELNINPFPKYKNQYMSIKRKEFYEKQVGGMKTLLPIERNLYKDPRWIGWKKYNISEFNPKDQKYLMKLKKDFKQIVL